MLAARLRLLVIDSPVTVRSVRLWRFYAQHHFCAAANGGALGKKETLTPVWSTVERRVAFMREAAAALGVRTPADWKNVRNSTLRSLPQGASLLRRYNDSLFLALKDLCIDGDRSALQEGDTWAEFASTSELAEALGRKPRGYWESWQNRKEMLLRVAASKGLEEVDSAATWKAVTEADLVACGGAGALALFDGSVHALLRDAFPEQTWEAFECRPAVPSGYWEEITHCQAFVAALAKRKGLSLSSTSERNISGWKGVKRKEVVNMGGRGFLRRFGSLAAALQELAPELCFDDQGEAQALIERRPRGFWDDASNRRQFVDEIASKMGINASSDWATVTAPDLDRLGGGGLLKRYNRSMLSLLQDVYSDELLDSGNCRPRRQANYWACRKRRREFVFELARTHGVVKMEDWGEVTAGHIIEAGGAMLLKKMGSVLNVLRDAYGRTFLDGKEWVELECRPKMRHGFWERKENIVEFIHLVEEALFVKNPSDWYRVSISQVRKVGGTGLLARMPLVEALRIVYPKQQWDTAAFSRGQKRAVQRHLLLTIEQLFPLDDRQFLNE